MQVTDVELPTGVRLRIAAAGDGGRPLLLVHGFTGAKEDFTDFLDDLAAHGWHAVAPDLRGHGDSDKPESVDAYSFEQFAADLDALTASLWGASAPFVLLGHSMGGMIAQFVLHHHADRVQAIVLMDTSHGPLKGLDGEVLALAKTIALEQGMAVLNATQKQMAGPLSTPANERLVRERPGYEEFGDRKFEASSPHMYASMIGRFADSPDRLAWLEGHSLPALVIVGEQDTPFLRPSERMADAIAGASLATIPDAGHSPQFENRVAWWDALRGFLAALDVDAVTP